MQGQVLSFRPNTPFGWYHVHLERYEMPIRCTTISAGTVSAVVQTDFTVLWEAAVEMLPASLLVTHPGGFTLQNVIFMTFHCFFLLTVFIN